MKKTKTIKLTEMEAAGFQTLAKREEAVNKTVLKIHNDMMIFWKELGKKYKLDHAKYIYAYDSVTKEVKILGKRSESLL